MISFEKRELLGAREPSGSIRKMEYPEELIANSRERDKVRFYRMGRHALLEALRVARVCPGDRVLIPAFICRDLLASIHAAGAEPHFYRVDRSLVAQSLPVCAGVKAVIAVNYFGFPQRLEPFRAYCAAHGATLIEDNAHGFLSRDERGKLLGTRGDLGIFSLRKTFAVPDGAALLINREDWIDRAPAPMSCRTDPLTMSFIVKRILRRVQNSTGVRVRSLGEKVTRHVRKVRTGHSSPISTPEIEKEVPDTPAIHCESLRMLQQIDMVEEVRRRRALYCDFHHHLRHLNIEPVFAEMPSGVSPYGYPFRADERTAATVASIANRGGFGCVYWPDLPTTVAPSAPNYYKNVCWINFLC